MAKIVRYNGNLVPFASSSLGTERTIFGEVTQADDITSQFTPDFLRGWGIVGPSDQPTLQDFNAVSYTHGQILSYLHQMGVPEYNAAQEYHLGSITNVSGVLYRSLANTNVGNPPATSPASWAAAESSASRVSGLLGVNNTGTPNTQLDLSASSVTLRNPTSGATAVLVNTGVITNNILTAGSVANGRDQAGAFANGSWVHFHFIYNGVALATLASTSSTAPVLPTGYTYSAYAHSVYLSAGGALTEGVIRGSWFQNKLAIAAVNNGNATGLTSVSLTAIIPPNALQFEIYSPNLALTALASGAYNLQCNVVISGTSTALQFGMQGTGAANAVTGASGASKRLQNIGQNFAYQLVVGAGVGYIVTIGVTGYSVPNGGE